MKTSKLLLGAAVVVIAACQAIFPSAALADTYQIFSIGDANSHLIYGIDTAGAVVIQFPNPVSGPDPFVYQTYVDGVLTNSSTTIPTLNYDDGTPCIPTVSAPITWISGIGKTRCNNDHEVYYGTFPVPPNSFEKGVFTGPNLTDQVPGTAALDMVVMNASGDFAWVDGNQELIFEAIDLTTAPTPEPSSIFLLGTGVLAAAGAMRRPKVFFLSLQKSARKFGLRL